MVRKTKRKPVHKPQSGNVDNAVIPENADGVIEAISEDTNVKVDQKPKVKSTGKSKKSNKVKKPVESPDTKPDQKDVDRKGPYLCDLCPSVLKNIKSFKEHQRSHKEKTHKCKECGKLFRYESVLKEHYLMHTGETPHNCPHCPKKFRTKSNMQRHLITHGVVSKARSLYKSQCEICGKILRLSSNLNAHRRSHQLERPFPCEQCGKQFKTKAHLGIHMANHLEVEPFECEECGKRFRNKSNYRKHLLIHKGDKCFKCNICDWTFVRRDQLKMHLRTHTKLFFQCLICEKQFKTEAYYKMHLSQHTTGNTFQCDICDKFYSSNSNLKMHMKKCHGSASSSLNENPAVDEKEKKKVTKGKEGVKEQSKENVITILFWKGKNNGGPIRKSVHQNLLEQVEESNESEMCSMEENTSSNECADIEQKSIEIAAKFCAETSTYHVPENTENAQMINLASETSTGVGHLPENSENTGIVKLSAETSAATHLLKIPKNAEMVKFVNETSSHVLENSKDEEIVKLSDKISASLPEKARLQTPEPTISTGTSNSDQEQKNANIEYCYQDKVGNAFLVNAQDMEKENDANDMEEESDILVKKNTTENEIDPNSPQGDSIKCIRLFVNGQENSLPSLEFVDEQHS